MELAIFQELGLSPNEAKIYRALLTYGSSGVSTISIRAKVHRRNAYDALQRLHHKGLVSEIYGKGETIYEAVEPGKLMELIHEKQMKLEGIMPSLRDIYQKKRATEHAYIYKGIEGVKNYLKEALNSGEDMYILGAEGAWLDPRLETYIDWFLKEAKKRNMKIYTLFEADAKDIEGAAGLLSTKHKFFPPKYDTPSTMDIFGDFVVTYTGTYPGKMLDDVTIFVMQSPELAKSYRTWWQLVWDLLPDPPQAKRGTKGQKRTKKS